MKKFGKILVVLAVLAALVLLNPTKDDFNTFRERRANDAVGSGLGSLAKLIVGGLSEMLYERDNYLLFSVFYVPVDERKTDRYLGVAKMFIHLDK